MAKTQWQRGGSIKSVGEILRRWTQSVAPASAARSTDESVRRVQWFLASRMSILDGLPPFEAVDRLLVVAGFNDKSRNRRLRWSKLMAHRLGADAPDAVAALLADLVADGSAASVGACLRYRLELIAQGRSQDAWSAKAPPEVVQAVSEALGRG